MCVEAVVVITASSVGSSSYLGRQLHDTYLLHLSAVELLAVVALEALVVLTISSVLSAGYYLKNCLRNSLT